MKEELEYSGIMNIPIPLQLQYLKGCDWRLVSTSLRNFK